ncbi:hypothetical protein N9917_04650 [Deltaproteobacteria bacterium]|nr:hypothetical protein [Deltaproteobacteria bacterium]
MPTTSQIIRSAFTSPQDEFNGMGKRPVVFDILGPDWETSLLPDDLKLVLHVNPASLSITYAKLIERIQTRGGYVEQHWGDAAQELSFEFASGGFVRIYSGMSNITSNKYGGNRRETIAYDKYLDLLALFHNNGSIHDSRGSIVLQGIIKVTFDGGVWLGWFSNFTVGESADKPYQFTLSAGFTVHREIMTFRTHLSSTGTTSAVSPTGSSEEVGQTSILDG